MDFKKIFKSLSKLEVLLLIVFIIYIVFPIETPTYLTGCIDSPLGMLIIFITSVYLFFHANSIVAVIYVLVAYELLRRSSQKKGQVILKEYKPHRTPTKKHSNSSVSNDIANSNLNPNSNSLKNNGTFNSSLVLENMVPNMNNSNMMNPNLNNIPNITSSAIQNSTMKNLNIPNITSVPFQNILNAGDLEITSVKNIPPTITPSIIGNTSYTQSDFKPILEILKSNASSIFT
jgi:hypothetical protein